MKRILITSAALLGLAGAAFAQEAPQLVGNYSANVLNAYNGTQDSGTQFSGQAALGAYDRSAPVQAQSASDGTNASTLLNDNYNR